MCFFFNCKYYNQYNVQLFLKNATDVDENFLKAMSDMRVDGEDANFNEGIFPMMQGMMMNLLSKDVLYPALDELRTKVNYLLYVTAFYYVLYLWRNALPLWPYRDYCMISGCVRFLCTSCERLLNKE